MGDDFRTPKAQYKDHDYWIESIKPGLYIYFIERLGLRIESSEHYERVVIANQEARKQIDALTAIAEPAPKRKAGRTRKEVKS